MQIQVNWSHEVSAKFPELVVCIGTITDTHNEKENERIEQLLTTSNRSRKEKSE